MTAKLFEAALGIHKSWMVTSEHCFKDGPDFLVIDPDECIDCVVCIPECLVNAIYADTDTPGRFIPFLALNERLAKRVAHPLQAQRAFVHSGQWKDKTNKLASVDLEY
jgi:ferredoxin